MSLTCSRKSTSHGKEWSCGEPPAPGKKYCQLCLDRARKKREARIATGTCEACSSPSVPGRRRCRVHAQAGMRYYRTRRDRLLTLGTCVFCGKVPSGSGSSMCDGCWFGTIAKATVGGRKRGPEIRQLFVDQDGKCAYTGTVLVPGVNASLDHKVPKASGGGDEIENLQWVALAVNHAKRALTEADFVGLCLSVVVHLGLKP